MTDDDLGRMIAELNAVTLPADRVSRMAPLVSDVNARVRGAADQRLSIDSVPWSFLTFRETGRGDRS